MNILPTPKGMPSILTARLGRYEPDGPLIGGREGRRVGVLEEVP